MEQAKVRYEDITPAMVAAGVDELREKSYGEDLREIVVDVYIAMKAAKDIEANNPLDLTIPGDA